MGANTTLRVGPYVQYYKVLSEQFGVLGTLGAGYQSSFVLFYCNSNNNPVVESKAKGFCASLTPGVIFFPVPKFGISAFIGGLGYDWVGVERSDDANVRTQSVSAFGVGFGLSQLLFGDTLFLGRQVVR